MDFYFFNFLRGLSLRLLPKHLCFDLSGVNYTKLHCHLNNLQISKSKKKVLLFLKQSAGFFDVAQISLKRIKKGTSFSSRTIYLAIRFWESAGVIEVVNCKDKRGSIITNRYILRLENLKCLEL